MKVTVLGCGGSGGVPLIGNIWGACNPHNSKNRRHRCSILVQQGETTLLVECGPDLREQLIKTQVSHVDACLVTHAHADHIHGIDDLRRLFWINGNVPVPLYTSPEAYAEMSHRFHYAFRPFRYGVDAEDIPLLYVPVEGPFRVGEIEVVPFVQDHGLNKTSLGFRFGHFAYSTDVVRMSEENFAALEGVTHWIVDCVQYAPGHKAHSHFAQTLKWIDRVRPRHAWLTHMGVDLDYDELLARCPAGVEPAYDGLEVHID